MEKNPFSKVCRLCLSTDVKLEAIFHKKRKTSTDYDKIILLLLGIQINSRESLPKKICMMCASVLQSFMHFRQKAEESEAKLRQLVKQMSEASQKQADPEPDEPECEYFEPPYEYQDDVVVIDPKSEYLSSGGESDYFENSEEANIEEVAGFTVVEINEAENNGDVDVEVEETEHEIELEPEDYSNLGPAILKAEPEHESEEHETEEMEEVNLKTTRVEPNLPEIPIIFEEPSVGILSNCTNIIADYRTAEEGEMLQVSQNSAEDVDDHVMQDIIDIIDDDIFAVLADPNCIDLETVENEIDTEITPTLAPVEVFICRFCDAAFATQALCGKHEVDHDPDIPFCCSICQNFKTSDRDAYIAHLKEVHEQMRPYKCFHCAKQFKKRTDLRKHAVSHAGLKTFVCAICHKNFSRRNNLRHHLKIHTGERFGCSSFGCLKSFSTKHALLEHEDFHKNASNFKCPLCGILVTRKRRLIDHERSCLKKNYQSLDVELDPENVIQCEPDLQLENDDLRFTCEVCLKSFTNKRVLRHHKATHSTVKNHVCPYCERAFLRRNELERHHISVHQQIKQFQCSSCEKSFSRKDKLLRHERIHTKGSEKSMT